MKGEKFPFSETAWPHCPYFFNIEKNIFAFFGQFQFEVAQIRGVLHF